MEVRMIPTADFGSSYLDVSGVSRLLGLHLETVRRLVREGRIPAFKAGRSWRFDPRHIEAMAQGGGEQRPMRILVVDDDPDICQVIRITLERAGYVVQTAQDGETAIRLLRAAPHDLVLLDLKLPRGSGVDVIRELRAISADVPVVIVTGYPDGDMLHQAMAYSPLVVLAKPVDPMTLRKTVDGAIRSVYGAERPRGSS
jgi:excisionase family DNA binding protein